MIIFPQQLQQLLCLLWLKAAEPALTSGGQCCPSFSQKLLILHTDTVTDRFRTCNTPTKSLLACQSVRQQMALWITRPGPPGCPGNTFMLEEEAPPPGSLSSQ